MHRPTTNELLANWQSSMILSEPDMDQQCGNMIRSTGVNGESSSQLLVNRLF
jgi:hypothetical protein